MIHILLAYDIVDTRRRSRLAKGLLNDLDRVQKSVFEGQLSQQAREDLQALIEKEIDPELDSVRIYHLCQRCQYAIQVLGLGDFIEEERDEII